MMGEPTIDRGRWIDDPSTHVCDQCNERTATTCWSGSVMEANHGSFGWRCDPCALAAQLDHAIQQAALIPELERQLAEALGDEEFRVRGERPAWMLRAACADKPRDLFFPPEHAPSQFARARIVCAGCPVGAECLEFAVVNQELGYWNSTERDRKALRSQRSKAGRAVA